MSLIVAEELDVLPYIVVFVPARFKLCATVLVQQSHRPIDARELCDPLVIVSVVHSLQYGVEGLVDCFDSISKGLNCVGFKAAADLDKIRLAIIL